MHRLNYSEDGLLTRLDESIVQFDWLDYSGSGDNNNNYRSFFYK